MRTIFSEVQIYLIFTQATLLYLPHFKDTLCVNWRIFVKIFVSATEFYCNKSNKFSLIRFCET